VSTWLIGLGVLIYLGTAVDQAIKHNWPMAGMWFCYATANVCLSFVNK
jgi:hypothetical protein